MNNETLKNLLMDTYKQGSIDMVKNLISLFSDPRLDMDGEMKEGIVLARTMLAGSLETAQTSLQGNARKPIEPRHRNQPNLRKPKIQAKHIPAEFLLDMIDHLVAIPQMSTWRPLYYAIPKEPNHTLYVYAQNALCSTQIFNVWPEIPDKVINAKLANLIKKGLVDGCTCGCRGDFHLTDEGRVALAKFRSEQKSTLHTRSDFLALKLPS